MPRVSIITSAYNITDLQYGTTVQSLNNQTSTDYEWIVVDDGSDSSFQYWSDVRLERNFGPSVARNAGFQVSGGDIITYVDMGDELAPDRVESLIHLFDQYDIDLLFSAYDIVEGGEVFRFDHMNFIGRSSRYPDASEYSKLWNYQNLSIPLGVAHTRRPFVLAGGFQRGIVCGEDGVLWRRMHHILPGNKIMYSDVFAGTYVVSQNGQSRTQRRFEMGAFAIDGSLRDNGRYLDEDWYNKFTSEGYYE